MVKRKGLGRGLDALLSGSSSTGASPADAIKAATEVAAEITSPSTIKDGTLKEIPVELLQRGKYQPRRDMHPEALEELAESIKAQGVMQPIVVRPIGEGRFEIIAGERRWRATQQAGLHTIPCVIREVPDETAIALALIENIQREDLNPVEEAMALKRFQDEFELTQQEVADAVGKSRSAITNLMRLLNLSDEVRTLLEHGDLEMGHARCLLTLESGTQKRVARQIVAKGMTVRQAEALARKTLQEESQPEEKKENTDHDIKKLEERLGEKVGVPVMVQHSAKGKGKLVLKYNSLDELDGILAHLGYEH
ncbi:ParB/RepB/Spo0J family partition protein [Teredinibacter haidensis]|uniref:ParB/RepB/Spo0J family partition protein n=1 Tax=Teredinibacter haidensis TaxID=2731755 RepID=UPI000948D7EE|nr:ParB/RepB/Spo0J family partition protein [Teredinibacter haidensis]